MLLCLSNLAVCEANKAQIGTPTMLDMLLTVLEDDETSAGPLAAATLLELSFERCVGALLYAHCRTGVVRQVMTSGSLRLVERARELVESVSNATVRTTLRQLCVLLENQDGDANVVPSFLALSHCAADQVG